MMPAPEKADAGDDLRRHPGRAVLARIEAREDHKARRADRDSVLVRKPAIR